MKDLVVNAENPRQISDLALEGLRASLDEFGYVEPIIYNQTTGNVLNGNQRLKILKNQLKDEDEIEVSVVELSEDDEQKLMLAINNPAIRGEFDKNALDILTRIEIKEPDLFDKLALGEIRRRLEGEAKNDLAEADILPKELELLPYEHYDYVVLFFKNQFDFMRAAELLELKKEAFVFGKRKKVGLGRGVDGKRFLELVEKNYVKDNRAEPQASA